MVTSNSTGVLLLRWRRRTLVSRTRAGRRGGTACRSPRCGQVGPPWRAGSRRAARRGRGGRCRGATAPGVAGRNADPLAVRDARRRCSRRSASRCPDRRRAGRASSPRRCATPRSAARSPRRARRPHRRRAAGAAGGRAVVPASTTKIATAAAALTALTAQQRLRTRVLQGRSPATSCSSAAATACSRDRGAGRPTRSPRGSTDLAAQLEGIGRSRGSSWTTAPRPGRGSGQGGSRPTSPGVTCRPSTPLMVDGGRVRPGRLPATATRRWPRGRPRPAARRARAGDAGPAPRAASSWPPCRAPGAAAGRDDADPLGQRPRRVAGPLRSRWPLGLPVDLRRRGRPPCRAGCSTGCCSEVGQIRGGVRAGPTAAGCPGWTGW